MHSQNHDKITISREQLYDMVWSKPMSTLASEFGITDIALAKRCRKLNVPRPARGYWAKMESGVKVPRPPLPSTIGGAEPQIR